MRIYVAGATGAIGRRLVPALVERGHDVVAMTRSPDKADDLRRLGAEPAIADGLDPEALTRALEDARPEVVVHQMTALAGVTSFRRFDRELETTNRLRTDGTDLLLSAARAAGTRRAVVQSFGNWWYAPVGGPVKSEEDPLDPSPPPDMRESLRAIRHLERAILGAEGIEGLVLRYGFLYGPGTGLSAGGSLVGAVRAGRFPVIGDGGGVWSFLHIDDAVGATVVAVERGAPGVYNIADDEPAPVRDWLPELARIAGARAPRRVPVWLGRLAAGEAGVRMFTRSRGGSNAKAARELGWRPWNPSWREGFRRALAAAPTGVPVAQPPMRAPGAATGGA